MSVYCEFMYMAQWNFELKITCVKKFHIRPKSSVLNLVVILILTVARDKLMLCSVSQ